MPIFTAIATAITSFTAMTVLGTSLTVGQLLTGIMLIGSIASSYMQQLAVRKMKAALAGIGNEGFTQTVRGAIVPQRTIYGEVAAGLAILYETVKPPLYISIGVFAAHEIDGISEIRVNGKPVATDADGLVISEPYWTDGSYGFASTAGGYGSLLRVSIRSGRPDQAADALLLKYCPELGANFRQRGHATCVVVADWGPSRDAFDKVWGGQFPAIVLVVRGRKLFDPRDPLQQISDPSTWRWACAPSLVGADILRHDDFGRMEPAELVWAEIADAADIDGQAVTTRDGTVEARYTADGIIDTSAGLADSLKSVLTANRGQLVRGPSGYAIRSGWMSNPVMTIHDGLIVGAIDYRSESPRERIANAVRTRIVAPDRDYQVVDGPVVEDDAALEVDGARYEKTLDLRFTRGAARGQRLGQAELRASRHGRQISTAIDVEALGLETGDVVLVDIAPLPRLAGRYEVTSIEFVDDLRAMQVTLSETDRTVFEFDPKTDEKPFEYEAVA